LQLDFVAANELEISNSRITGRVDMPLGWERIGCFCKISVCKRYHLEKFARQFDVSIENTLAVGDTKSDICMIRRAGAGIAFMPKDSEIANATDKIVQDSDLLKVLEFAA
jgi:phosphoserine phosphatase